MSIFALDLTTLKYRLLLLVISISGLLAAQESGTLLLISESTCTVTIDADASYTLTAGEPLKVSLLAGAHLLQQDCTPDEHGKPATTAIEIEVGKNLIKQFSPSELPTKATGDVSGRISLINTDVSLPGSLNSAMQESYEQDYSTSGLPVFHYYFQAGDRVIINAARKEEKGTHAIIVMNGTDGTTLFSRDQFEALEQQVIDIHADGTYIIAFGTNYFIDRTLQLSIERIPSHAASEILSSRVELRHRYEVVTLQEPTAYWINSTSNASFRDGQSTVTVPVQLPDNTVEWYYILTANEEEEQTDRQVGNFDLSGELSSLLFGSTAVAGIASNLLQGISQPAGGNYCDTKLLDHQNYLYANSGQSHSYFPEGSRDNISSAKVKISTALFSPAYIAITNDQFTSGISVGIEVVAITDTPYYTSVSAK